MSVKGISQEQSTTVISPTKSVTLRIARFNPNKDSEKNSWTLKYRMKNGLQFLM